MDLRSAKRRELDRNSQLKSFEEEYSSISQFIASKLVQTEKFAFKIGNNIEEAQQLHHAHMEMISTVNNVEPSYENVLNTGRRLADSRAGINQIEMHLKRLTADWSLLKQRLSERTDLLKLALDFHSRYKTYMQQADKWILNVGVNPTSVLNKSIQELQVAHENHKKFKANYDEAYSEMFDSLGQLQKKVNRDHNSASGSGKYLHDCMKHMVHVRKQILNAWESRNLSIDQRIKAHLLLPEVRAVLEWLDIHGETFLKRKFAIGKDYDTAVVLERTHMKFREIANCTYTNAHSLINTADELISNGEIDAEQTRRLVNELCNRIRDFTIKVDSRSRLLYMAKNFFNHYREMMDYYAKLDNRNEEIRIVPLTPDLAEQQKESFQLQNDCCNQAYEKVICEANQLIAQLQEQHQLLNVRNEDTILSIQGLRADIEQKNSLERSRWPTQREVLKQAASCITFFKCCEQLYDDIVRWDHDLKGLCERERIPDRHSGEIARHHWMNITSVKTSVDDALKNADKLKEEIEGLGLIMSDKQTALAAIEKVRYEIKNLEDKVMKRASEVSGRLQSKGLADKVRMKTHEIKDEIDKCFVDLLKKPCLPHNLERSKEIKREFQAIQNQSDILRELVITYEQNTNACMDKLLDVDTIQDLKVLLDEVKTRFAKYVRTRESREKLVTSAYEFYYCIGTAIPGMKTLDARYRAAKENQMKNCEREQNEELVHRRDNFSVRMAKHMEEKPKFVNGAMYAQRCADKFLARLKSFEMENCRNNSQPQSTEEVALRLHDKVLNSKCEIEQYQQGLTKLWHEIQVDLFTCKQACNLEILAKQVTDGIRLCAAKLSDEVPPMDSIRNLPKREVEIILERVVDYRRSLEMNADIKDLRDKMSDFNNQSYHTPFVEKAIRQAEAQYNELESTLVKHNRQLNGLLGRKVEDIPNVKSKILTRENKTAHQNRDSNDFTKHSDNLKKLKDPMQELLASEMDYINDLRRCIEVYLKSYRMDESSLPVSLQKKEREIFGNIENLYHFHAGQLYRALSGYEHNPEEVGCCFYAYVEQLKEHYTDYILNNEENSSIINQPETIAVFDEIQRRHGLEPNHSLQSMLIKPIQRITRYPMLLGQFMKYTVGNRKDMETALDSMLGIPRAANDRVHLKHFEDVEKHRIGNFVMQDSMIVSESKRYFRRDKELQVFLFESNILFAKKEELPMKKIRYLCKFRYFLSDLHIVEHIEGDAAKFGLRKGSLPQGDQTTVLKAQTEESKKHWVKTLRELVLLMSDKNQISDNESIGTTRYNESTIVGSLKSISIADSQRLSNASFDSANSMDNRSSDSKELNNNPLTVVEMRRPKQLNGVPTKPRFASDGLVNEDYMLPLSEDNQGYPLLSEMNAGPETPISLACKRSTVSSTASSDDLPPAMEQLSVVAPQSDANGR
ncbi:hypothetical protein M3Y96_00107200 [Aphelenchoides besseyi]|nr:hypothetical protein M3Y96_00107200 [Aphelenchoides besseyi]